MGDTERAVNHCEELDRDDMISAREESAGDTQERRSRASEGRSISEESDYKENDRLTDLDQVLGRGERNLIRNNSIRSRGPRRSLGYISPRRLRSLLENVEQSSLSVSENKNERHSDLASLFTYSEKDSAPSENKKEGPHNVRARRSHTLASMLPKFDPSTVRLKPTKRTNQPQSNDREE